MEGSAIRSGNGTRLRKDCDDDSAGNDHDDPRNIKHDVADSDRWNHLAHKPQRWIGQAINTVNENEEKALGSKISFEHNNPVENEPRPQNVGVYEQRDLKTEADTKKNRHGLLSGYEERTRARLVTHLLLRAAHLDVLGAQQEDFTRDTFNLASKAHHKTTREVDETLSVVLIHS